MQKERVSVHSKEKILKILKKNLLKKRISDINPAAVFGFLGIKNGAGEEKK